MLFLRIFVFPQFSHNFPTKKHKSYEFYKKIYKMLENINAPQNDIKGYGTIRKILSYIIIQIKTQRDNYFITFKALTFVGAFLLHNKKMQFLNCIF